MRNTMPNQADRITTFRDRLRVFFRWQYLFLFSAAAVAIVVLLLAHNVEIEYSAATVFEMRVGMIVPDRGMGGVSDTEELKRLRQTVRQRMTNREAILAVGQKLGLFDPPDEDDDRTPEQIEADNRSTIGGIRKNLDVRWSAQSEEVDLVTLVFSCDDADLAYRMPNELVAHYGTTVQAERVAELTQSFDFLNGKSDEYRSVVKKMTYDKVTLETEHIGLMEEPQMDIVRRQMQAKADRDAVAALLKIAKDRLRSLQKLKEGAEEEETEVPAQIIKGPNPELERLGQELREYKTELDLAMTLQHMTRDHPAIRTLLTRIAIMEERIRKTPEEIVLQTVYDFGSGGEAYAAEVAAAQTEVEILQAELHRVDSQIEGYKKMMIGFEEVRPRYIAIIDELKDAESKAEMWESRRRQVEMALEAARGTTPDMPGMLTILEEAQRPTIPSFPRLNHVFAVALFGALAAGSLLVFFWNSKDRTVGTTEDAARYFDVPVIGSVGQIMTRGVRGKRFFRRWLIVPIVAAVMFLVIAVLVLSITLRLRRPEQYKQWREEPVAYATDKLTGETESADDTVDGTQP
jgi:hypothetical protein